jgi:transcriptional regulator with XRE-family HTH domain
LDAENRLRRAIHRLSKDGRGRDPKDARPSKKKVAAAIGMKPQQFSKWLTGGTGGPQVCHLDAIASILRCRIAELVDPRWHEHLAPVTLSEEAVTLARNWDAIAGTEGDRAKALISQHVDLLLAQQIGGNEDSERRHTPTAVVRSSARRSRKAV